MLPGRYTAEDIFFPGEGGLVTVGSAAGRASSLLGARGCRSCQDCAAWVDWVDWGD